jgi:hypothetical protein
MFNRCLASEAKDNKGVREGSSLNAGSATSFQLLVEQSVMHAQRAAIYTDVREAESLKKYLGSPHTVHLFSCVARASRP